MRSGPRPTDEELERGIPLFLDQLAQALRATPDAVAVNADRPLLAAALTNLLTNALKFSSEGGHVTLRVLATACRRRITKTCSCPGHGGALTRRGSDWDCRSPGEASRRTAEKSVCEICPARDASSASAWYDLQR